MNSPHHTNKLLNNIWHLNPLPRIKIFAWKLIKHKLSTNNRLRKIGIILMEIVLHASKSRKKTIIFSKVYEMAKITWATVDTNCPSPNNHDLSFVNWNDHILDNKGSYNKIFHNPLENFLPNLGWFRIVNNLTFEIILVIHLGSNWRQELISLLYSIVILLKIFSKIWIQVKDIKTRSICISIIIGILLKDSLNGMHMLLDRILDRQLSTMSVGNSMEESSKGLDIR